MKKCNTAILIFFIISVQFLFAGGKNETFIPDLPSETGNNLALNPSFENDTQGWEGLWTREESAGKVRIVSNRNIEGKKALEVIHHGSEDWSLGQVRRVAVVPGEVYEISALALIEKEGGSVQVSVVTRTRENDVISWMHGIAETRDSANWVVLASKFIVPKNCTNLQLRLTGRGPVKAKLDRVQFKKLREAPEKLHFDKDEYLISGTDFELRYIPGENLFMITQKAGGNVYTIEGSGPDLVLSGFVYTKNSFSLQFYNTESSNIHAEFFLHDNGKLEISLEGDTALPGKLRFPGVLRAEEQDLWTIPQNEGLLVPAMDPWYKPWELAFFQGHGGLSMPFIGLTRAGDSILLLCNTADDASLKYHKPDPTLKRSSGIQFVWHGQKGKLNYRRSFSIFSLPDADYVGIAKAYRKIAKEAGKLVTLEEKKKLIPEIDRLVGTANVWWWKVAEWWQDDPDSWKAAQELKEAGIDKVLWSNTNSREEIGKINELGYLTGKYDIYQDVWSPKTPIKYGNRKGWPEDLVLLPDGSPMRGWVHIEDGKEYPGGVICSEPGLERLKKTVATVLKDKPYLARFLDTTTASSLRECYNPDHPLTRSQDRINKSEMLSVLGRKFGLVTGSETGIDWAVPYLHYFEGMMSLGPYRLDDAGYNLTAYKEPTDKIMRFQIGPFYRIPLFELVYHDCVVSYWYWGDSSNRFPELWRDRDLFNLLYGTGPLYILDWKRWKEQKDMFINSYKTATKTSSITAYSQMTMHRFLNSDHSVQYSEFANGTRVWVNFGDVDFATSEGIGLSPKAYVVKQADDF